jgi:glycine hydroxymethyltransferase
MNGDCASSRVEPNRTSSWSICAPRTSPARKPRQLLGAAHMTVNKNAIPNDPQKPFVTSGIRLGSPAMTTRGFTEIESEQVAHLIADVLDAPTDAEVLARVRNDVSKLCRKFPVYGGSAR